jgi:hypothetical protein
MLERVIHSALFRLALMPLEVGLKLLFGFFCVNHKFPPRAERQLAHIAICGVRSAPDESDNHQPAVRHGDMMAGVNRRVKCFGVPHNTGPRFTAPRLQFLLQFFDFLSHRRQQWWRQFGIAFLHRIALAIRVHPLQQIA